MNRIDEAISLIEAEITKRGASCIIYSDTGPDESTMGGTRDGYLNVIRILLKLIADFDDRGHSELWDDQIKRNMLGLPSFNETWVVGTQVFRDHSALIESLKEAYSNQPMIIQSIENDPDFKETEN